MSDHPGSENVAYVGLIVATLIFSVTPVFIRLSEVGPSATGFWRFLITVPFMLLWIAATSRRGRMRILLKNRRDYLWMVFAGLMVTLNVVAWQSAVLQTSIANAVLISNLHPIIVAAGAYVVFRERITPLFAGGLMLTVVGTAALIREGAGEFRLVSAGDGLALIGAFFFALWVLCLKSQRGSYSTPVTMLWNLGLACPMILGFSFVLDDAVFPTTTQGWAIIGAYGISVSVVALSIFTYVTGRLPASICATALLIVPVFSTAYGWLFFGEGLSLTQASAASLILTGLYLAQRGHQPRVPG